MNYSKKYIAVGIVVAIVIALVFVSFSTIKNELGLSSKAGINYNKLSISEDEIDADLKAIADNKPLNDLLAEAQDPLVKDGKVTPTYRASWANIKMRTLAIKEVRLDKDLKVTKKDRKDATKDAKELFTGADQNATEEIWDAFPDSFQNRLVDSFAEQYALLRSAPKVTDKEVEKYFNENKDTIAPPCESGKSISHILVADEATAKTIESDLKAGGDFAKIAGEKSTDPGSKDSGGKLGCYSAGNFVPEFEAAALALAPGSISQIVKTDFGYHILKAETFTMPTLKESSDQIRAQIESEKQSKVFDAVQKGLEKAKVKVSSKYGRVTIEEKLPVIVPSKKDVPETTVPDAGSPTNSLPESEPVPTS